MRGARGNSRPYQSEPFHRSEIRRVRRWNRGVGAQKLLLSKHFRSFSSRDKAYWGFIAAQAAGAEDEEARRVLVSFARDADDETFRRRAQRHLDAAAPQRGPVLSTESLEIIATVEETIRKASGRRRLRS